MESGKNFYVSDRKSREKVDKLYFTTIQLHLAGLNIVTRCSPLRADSIMCFRLTNICVLQKSVCVICCSRPT